MPRPDTSPRRRRLCRVGPNIITDPATASTAIRSGDEESWQTPTTDLPLLRKARGVAVERFDEFGSVGRDALQHVASPIDNVKLRRALRR